MPSHDTVEATNKALQHGAFTGITTLLPSFLGVRYFTNHNPTFHNATNWQSRTAMVLMPAMFVFAYSSEQKLHHTLREKSHVKNHSKEMTEWYLQQPQSNVSEHKEAPLNSGLLSIYQQSILDANIRVIPGNTLPIFYQLANFSQQHPFQLIGLIGLPTIFYIFHSRTHQQHLQLQSQIMHTRVYGQFAILTMCLALMGVKSYMDTQGTFITELEAKRLMENMNKLKEEALLQMERDSILEEKRQRLLDRYRQGERSKQV